MKADDAVSYIGDAGLESESQLRADSMEQRRQSRRQIIEDRLAWAIRTSGKYNGGSGAIVVELMREDVETAR